jgi:hypothetical protein
LADAAIDEGNHHTKSVRNGSAHPRSRQS